MIIWRSKAASNSVSLIFNVRMDVLTQSFAHTILTFNWKRNAYTHTQHSRQAVCCLFICSHHLLSFVNTNNKKAIKFKPKFIYFAFGNQVSMALIDVVDVHHTNLLTFCMPNKTNKLIKSIALFKQNFDSVQ